MKRALDWAGYIGLAAAGRRPSCWPVRAGAGARGPWVWWGLAGRRRRARPGLVPGARRASIADGVTRPHRCATASTPGSWCCSCSGVIGLVEALSYRHNARLDLTENRRHSLSPQTIQLLKALKTDVNAVAFFRSDQPGKRVAEDLFKQYARYAGEQASPGRSSTPTASRRWPGATAWSPTAPSCWRPRSGPRRCSDAEEEKLTNGLVKVTREGKRVVYVLQGHGEPELGNTDRSGFSEAKTAHGAARTTR